MKKFNTFAVILRFMKMKRFLAIISAVAVLTACDDIVTPNASIEPRSVAMDCNGGTSVFALTCNTTWTASCDYEDVKIHPSEGDGNASVTVTVPPSIYEETQVIRISVVAANDETESTYTARHIITLEAKPFLRLARTDGYVSPDGGGVRLDVYSNKAWSVKAEPADFVTLSQTEGENNASLTVTVPENNTGSARSSHITLSLKDVPGVSAEYTLTQNAK